jgi:hypothetical protein
MLIRLVRKLADNLDGIDVSGHQEGDVLDLPAGRAALLIAEQWAVPVRGRERRAASTIKESSLAADHCARRTRKPSRRGSG